MKKRCFNKFLMAWGMAIGLLIPSSVSAQVNWNELDPNGKVWGHILDDEDEIYSTRSSSLTNNNKIVALWNVGAKKYIYQGGHWGTEGMLSDQFTPFYLYTDGTYVYMPNNFISSNQSTAMSTGASYKLGYVSGSNATTKDDVGIYIDNASGQSTSQAAQFTYTLLDSEKKIYAITHTVSGGILVPQETIGEGGEFYLYNHADKTDYYINRNTTGARSQTTRTTKWTFTRGEDGLYTIMDEDYYLYCNNSGNLACANSKVTDGYKWEYANGVFSTTVNGTTRYLNVPKTQSTTVSTVTEEAKAVKYAAATLGTGTLYLDRLGVEGNESSPRFNIITLKPYASTADLPETAKWKIITKSDFITAFDNTEATNAAPADATFFIGNPGLCREGGNTWTFANSGGYTRIGNSLNYNKSTQPNSNAGGAIEEGGSNTNTLGNNYSLTASDVATGMTTQPEGSTVYYQAVYGGLFNGRIYGTSGSISQTVDVSRKGYYILGVYAYVKGAGTATLSATASSNGSKGGKYAGTQAIPVAGEDVLQANGNPFTMNQAGMFFGTQEENSSKYYVTTMVYIDGNKASKAATEDLNISVSLTGGSNTTVQLDNFRLYYVGDADLIILDENEIDYQYITPQVTNENKNSARTLILKRAMNTGVWNSIALPVNLSTSQVRTAFGNTTRLARYEKVDKDLKHIIWFKEIDITKDGTAIEAGKNYIIMPSDDTSSKSGSWTTNFPMQSVREKNIAEWTVDAKPESPVFTIPQVTLSQVPEDNADPDSEIHTSTDREILNFCSTYYAGKLVTPNSYIIAGNNSSETEGSTDNYSAGIWYHWTGKNNLNVKGFRCWIGSTGRTNEEYVEQTNSDEEEENPGNAEEGGKTEAKLTFLIVNDEGETTAIPMIKTENGEYEPATPSAYNDNVYSVNGQLVGKGINALKNLAKGIYIVNGKKYVVK